MWRPSPQNRRLTRVAPPRAPVPHPFRHTTPSRSSGLSPDTGQTPKASPRPLPETRPHKARDAAALPEDAAVGGAPTGGGVDPGVRSGAHPTAAGLRGHVRPAPRFVLLRSRPGCRQHPRRRRGHWLRGAPRYPSHQGRRVTVPCPAAAQSRRGRCRVLVGTKGDTRSGNTHHVLSAVCRLLSPHGNRSTLTREQLAPLGRLGRPTRTSAAEAPCPTPI